MSVLSGDRTGLRSGQIRRLENLSRRRVPPGFLVSPDLAREMARASEEIGRQVGVLIDRSGKIPYVVVGDAERIVIPDTPDYRTLPGRLKGLRCVHTHLGGEPLTPDDLNDLALLRLDFMAVLTLTRDAGVDRIHVGHILPGGPAEAPYRVLEPLTPDRLDIGCAERIRALEDELSEIRALYAGDAGQERAILVSVTTASRREALDSLDELRELARSNGVLVADTVLQLRKKADSRFLVGSGKLEELTLLALQEGATLVVFDQELNPSQIRSIADRMDLKVIDRTQLILDIFAQRARTREGKLQVELAQLKYLLPRLVTKNTAMSRLTGGIGGRGPGETKLEINRRRVRERINRLEKALKEVVRQRDQRKARRERRGLPVISIVGYTNAGKSTLLNTLTQSEVAAENRLFATLDPSSRRLRFPRDVEAIITDTVGFIRDLPKDLMVAFRATLEELRGADLLLHVVDIGNPRHPDQIRSVERILEELGLENTPVIRVLNKQDRVDPGSLPDLVRRLDGVPVSALRRETLRPLVEKMAERVENLSTAP
jgi:GTPase